MNEANNDDNKKKRKKRQIIWGGIVLLIIVVLFLVGWLSRAKNIHQLSSKEIAEELARLPRGSDRTKILSNLNLDGNNCDIASSGTFQKYASLVATFFYPAQYQQSERNVDSQIKKENMVLIAGHAGAQRIVVSVAPWEGTISEFPAVKMRKTFPLKYQADDLMLDGENALVFSSREEIAKVLFIKHDGSLVTLAVSSLENNSEKIVEEVFNAIIQSWKWH